MDKSRFRFKTRIRVRNYEVDWQGIVHNANYLLYFEIGRIEYLKHLGVRIDLNAVRKHSRVVLVRNEIDYKSPAFFDEVLDVYTRVSYIRNSSFGFEGIIEEPVKHRLVATNVAVHVWLSPTSHAAIPVASSFRKAVQKFEKSQILTARGGRKRP